MADYYRQKKIYDALRASETPENPFDERQKKLLDTIGISLGEEEKRQNEFVSGALRNIPTAVAPGLSTIGPLMVKARREYPSIVRPIEQAAMGYLDTAALGAFSTAAKLADPESEVETAPRNIPEHLAKGLGQLGGFIQGAPLRIGKAATTQILKSAAGKGLANKAVKFGEALAGKIIGKTAAGKALGQTGLAEASRAAVKEALTLGVASAVSANESLADYLRTPSYDTAAKIASEKGFSAAFGTLTGGQFGVVMGAFDKFATRAAINLALTNAMRIGMSGGEINKPDIIFGSLLDIVGSIGGKKPTKQELATLSQVAKDVEPAVTEALNKIHTELPETAPKAGKQAELPLQEELFSATKPAEPGFQKRGEVFPKDPALAKVEQLEQKPNLTPPEVDAALMERTLELEQAGKTLEGDPILTRLDNLSRRLYSQKPPEKPERPGQQTLDLSTEPTQAELPLETFTRRGDVEKPQTFESRGEALQPETPPAGPTVTPVPKPITDFKAGDKINITPFGELIITKVGKNQLKAKREGSDTEIIVSKDTVQKFSQPEPAQTAPPISEPAQATPPATGSQNTIFTQSAYETALASLKQNAGKLYDIGGALGDTPETIKNWVVIGGYHLERGVRNFNAWSKHMLDELGEQIRPYLRSIWDAANKGLTNKSLDFSNLDPQPFFYSQMREVLRRKLPESGTPESMLQALEGMQKSGEFSRDEFEWSRISDFLKSAKEQKIKVKKQDILELADSNNIRVEVNTRENKDQVQLRRSLEEAYRKRTGREPLDADNFGTEDFEASPEGERWIETWRDKRGARFSKYTLDGGKSGENYTELTFNVPNVEYQSPNFEDIGTIAHARTTDRSNIAGQKVKLIEEIQSELHQQGRKKGYEYVSPDRLNTLRAKISDNQKERRRLEALYRIEGITLPQKKQLKQLENEFSSLTAELFELTSIAPPAPLKSDWPTTVFKWLLRDAVDKGQDKIAWTTAEEQFNRYGSERIEWQKQKSGIWIIEAYGSVFPKTSVFKPSAAMLNPVFSDPRLETLSGYHTYDPAIRTKGDLYKIIKRILPEPDKQRNQELTDRIWEQMQVQDSGVVMPRKEGMEQFYDKALSSAVNKYIKKWGGKVETDQIPTSQGNVPVHAVTITPEMKQAVRTGQPISGTQTTLVPEASYRSALETIRTASIEAAKGVYELAGGSRLGAIAGGFTRQDYEQAAPHFRKAWETVGAYHAERLSKSDNLRYQPWTQAMVKDLGEGIRPRLEHIWQSVQDDFAANIKVGRYPAGTQDILRQMTSDATTPAQSERVRRGVLTRERRQNLARLEGDYIERARKGIELKHKDRRATPEQLEALNAEVARRAIEFQKDPNLLRETLRDPEKSKEIHNLILTQQRETADAGRKLEMLKGAVDPGVAEGFAMLFKYSENPELKEAAKEMTKSFEKGAPPKASFMHYWTELQRNFLLALSSATKSVASTALAIAYRFPVRTLASWIEIAAHKDPKQREIFWQGVIGEATQGYLKRENWKKGAVDFMKVIKEDDVALRESSMLQTETQGVRAFKRFGRTIRFEQNLQGGIDAFGRNILTPGIIADKIVTLARREGLTPSKDPVSDYVKRIDALQRDVQAVLDIQNNGHVAAREAGFTIGSREYYQAYNAFVKQELAKVPNADQVVDIIKRSRKEAAEELGLGDLTGVAGAVQKFRQQHLWTKLIVPFFPSFANFMKKAVAHTPFAAVMPSFYKAAYRALHTKGELPESSWGRFQEFMFGKTIKEMKAEDRTTAEFSERLSRMVFGSAVISTGFSLIVDMIDGKISGRGPDDLRIKDMMNKANGWKPYSVKIGDEWISYLGYEPLSTWMALMADWQYEDNQDLSSLDKIAKSFKTLATTSLENPFMLGIKGMMEAAEQDRKTSTYVSNFIGSFTMPTVARQFRYVLDPIYRVTKEKEILTGAWEKYQARVPGLSEQFLPRIDVFGNPVEKEYPLLSMIGINVSDAKYSKAAQEMVRLKINIGEPGEMIKGVNLSPREHQMLKIITGRALKEGLEKLIQTPGYKNLPDDGKREHIEASIRAIRNQARGELQRQLRFYPR